MSTAYPFAILKALRFGQQDDSAALATGNAVLPANAAPLPPEPGENWQFLGTLHSGGSGHAGLWARRDDATQQILQRAVVKETHLASDEWEHVSKWSSVAPRVAREAQIRKMLAELPLGGFFAEPFGHDVYEDGKCIADPAAGDVVSL
ncbi:hypothetical protein LTR08_006231 [Meristemomyces frigidus]|nr:hypothetical protein LTR08_006231 [Meristemomyces frigidus]